MIGIGKEKPIYDCITGKFQEALLKNDYKQSSEGLTGYGINIHE